MVSSRTITKKSFFRNCTPNHAITSTNEVIKAY